MIEILVGLKKISNSSLDWPNDQKEVSQQKKRTFRAQLNMYYFIITALEPLSLIW
jgi:hypothetical protein